MVGNAKEVTVVGFTLNTDAKNRSEDIKIA